MNRNAALMFGHSFYPSLWHYVMETYMNDASQFGKSAFQKRRTNKRKLHSDLLLWLYIIMIACWLEYISCNFHIQMLYDNQFEIFVLLFMEKSKAI